MTPSTLTDKQKEMPQTGNETTLTQLMAMRLIKKSEERVTKQKVDNYWKELELREEVPSVLLLVI